MEDVRRETWRAVKVGKVYLRVEVAREREETLRESKEEYTREREREIDQTCLDNVRFFKLRQLLIIGCAVYSSFEF